MQWILENTAKIISLSTKCHHAPTHTETVCSSSLLCTANELRHCFISTLPFPLLAQLSIILYDFLAISVFLELLHPLLSYLAYNVYLFILICPVWTNSTNILNINLFSMIRFRDNLLKSVFISLSLYFATTFMYIFNYWHLSIIICYLLYGFPAFCHIYMTFSKNVFWCGYYFFIFFVNLHACTDLGWFACLWVRVVCPASWDALVDHTGQGLKELLLPLLPECWD